MASLGMKRVNCLLVSYAVSFTASVLQILYLPLLSVHALRVGIGGSEIGFISGLGALVYALVTPLASSASSRLGVARTAALSLLTLSISYATLPFLKSVTALTLISVITYFSYALLWPSLEAMIAREGGSSSNFSASWSTGTLLGSALASYFLQLPETMAFTLLSATVLPFLLLLVRAHGSSRVHQTELSDTLAAAASLLKHLRLSFAYAASLGGVLAFYPLIVEAKALPIWLVSLSFFTMIGARTITFISYNVLPRAVKKQLSLGALLLTPLAALPYLNGILPVAVVSALAGIGQGLLYAAALDEVFAKGGGCAYTGVFESSIGLGYVAGPIIAGLASTVSLELSIPATVALATAVPLLPLPIKSKSENWITVAQG